MLQRCQHHFLSFSDMAPEGAVDRLLLHLQLTRAVTSRPGHERATAERQQNALPPLRLHVWARTIAHYHGMLAAAGIPAQVISAGGKAEAAVAYSQTLLAEGWGGYARTSTYAKTSAGAKRARVQQERQLRLLELLAYQVLRT